VLHGWILDNETPVDEVMACVMRAPHSYTGEEVVEISGHGGPVTLNRIVRLCIAKGARLAQPGEFTFRAFVNGRIDLSRAEAVADLIESKTELAAEISLQQLKGNLARRIQAWRQDLIRMISCLEVALDYGEEDIQFMSSQEIEQQLHSLKNAVDELQSSAEKGKYFREGIRLVIIGKPNAGKSSLLNALLERERSIVTDIPGTTRDIIEEMLDCRGVPLVILDTAGLREHTSDPVEKIGQERTIASAKTSDLILLLLDASAPLSDADRHIASLLFPLQRHQKLIVVLNKIDKGSSLTMKEINGLIPTPANIISISALERRGLNDLEDAIIKTMDTATSSDTPLLANLRHRDVLKRASHALEESLEALHRQSSEEIIAFHVREALTTLGEITGETTTEDILTSIFSHFCVGK
jgi:tRNA modification GTPase